MQKVSDMAEKSRRDEQDLKWIDEVLAGDLSAYENLFEKYREKIFRVVYGYVYNKEVALDITQEAFIKAFRNLEKFRRKSKFYTWLCQIAINRAIDYRRKQKRRKQHVHLEDYHEPEKRLASSTRPSDPPEFAEYEEMKEAYRRAIEKLSDKHRTVFLLNTVEDMSYREIAETLDISIGTVMSRLHYARKKLQKLLKDHIG